jgi:ParB/RepB/Spo0J family partition protein
MPETTSKLEHISPDRIIRNPENPRLFFRENELRGLLESIREVGIRVPISVYAEARKYVLIDGERRWRCALKLNLKQVPAIIQPKPTRLENLLMMFNIHNVRVQWDLLPMAYKLQDIQKMLKKEEKPTGARELAAITGLSSSMVKRAFAVLALPKKYQKMLLQEGTKPRDEQKITADLFIEINNAFRAVEKYTPEVLEHVSASKFVDAMFSKYVDGVENNVVNFRNVSKIARAEKTGIDKRKVIPILVALVKKPVYSVEDAYADTVGVAYEVRNLNSKVSSLADALSKYRNVKPLPTEFKRNLLRLKGEIDKLLGGTK